ncbi:type II secretion system F family protein [Candidatus Bathyarchaeota archaeon]|nr:type II secretion system F family protein [Candidatus Bathyarchaeota archaeon]
MSIILGLIIIFSAGAFWLLTRQPGWDNFIVLGLIVTIFPPSVVDLINRRWKKGIEDHLPDLLRDLASSQRTGMTFAKAIEFSSKRDYGPLTPELQKVVAQMTWGVPYEVALQSLADRVDTPLVRQAMMLIVETGRSGGNIQAIMEAIYAHIRELQAVERERRAQIRPYMLIAYVAFLVFLFTVVMLYRMLFAQFGTIQRTLFFGPVTPVAPETYKTLFFHMAVIEAFFGGLIAGKMGEGAMGAGLKHSLILIFIGFLTFNFFL